MRTAGWFFQPYVVQVSARTTCRVSTRCLPSRRSSRTAADLAKLGYGRNVCTPLTFPCSRRGHSAVHLRNGQTGRPAGGSSAQRRASRGALPGGGGAAKGTGHPGGGGSH